jgi:hypothetical protein
LTKIIDGQIITEAQAQVGFALVKFGTEELPNDLTYYINTRTITLTIVVILDPNSENLK